MEKWFKEKSEDLREQAGENTWARIEQRLERRKRPSSTVVLRVWPVAAGFLLVLGILTLLYLQPFGAYDGLTSITQNDSAALAVNGTPEAVSDLQLDSYSKAYYAELNEWIREAHQREFVRERE